MEKPNTDWINPSIKAATVEITAVGVNEQRKAQKAAEKKSMKHTKLDNLTAAKHKFEGITMTRRNLKDKIITCDEALAHYNVIGVPNQ